MDTNPSFCCTKRYCVLYLCRSLCIQTNLIQTWTQWLIIHPGNEMPKPRTAPRREGKGRPHPAHGHTHTAVMDDNNIFISLLEANSDSILASWRKVGNLSDEGKSSKDPPHQTRPPHPPNSERSRRLETCHMSEIVNWAINNPLRICMCASLSRAN